MMKLTSAEKKWLDDLQRLLDKCPSERLGFYTIGDPQITVYDRSKEDVINGIMDNSNSDFGNAVDKADADTNVTLEFPAPVHSVAG